MPDYVFETKPFEHQQNIFDKTATLPAYGLLWEQGCGKTKPIIDTCAYLYELGEINGMLVVAPAGVERNWLSDEIPKHMPKRVRDQMRIMLWETAKSKTKTHQYAFNALVAYPNLSILCLSYHAFMTPLGKKVAWNFLKRRNVLYVLDESDDIKTPKAKRTRSITASGRWAKYRRIMTGTPADKPFDVYSQFRFLDPYIWKSRKMETFHAFKQHFGKWEMAKDIKEATGYDPGYDELQGYRNLPELAETISPVFKSVVENGSAQIAAKIIHQSIFPNDEKAGGHIMIS